LFMDPLTLNVAARVASNPDTILRLIVKGVLADRNVNVLIEAWEEAAKDDWEEASGVEIDKATSDLHSTPDLQRWEEKNLDFLHSARKVVPILQKAWLRAYKRIDRQGTGDMGPFVWPEKLDDDKMARPIAEAIGTALGERDGHDGVEMRKYYETQRQR